MIPCKCPKCLYEWLEDADLLGVHKFMQIEFKNNPDKIYDILCDDCMPEDIEEGDYIICK
jgi:phage-related protein